jgi:uncharacterized protein (DUF58 family)
VSPSADPMVDHGSRRVVGRGADRAVDRALPEPPAVLAGRRGLRITTAGGMSLLLAVAAAQVWGRSGSAWMWMVVAVIVGLVVFDGVASWWALRHPDLDVVGAPDAVVGRSDPLTLSVRRPGGRSLIRVTSVANASWVRVDAPQVGRLDVVPDRRGVFGAAVFELQVRAPFGLVAVNRSVTLSLSHPVHVAPSEEPMDMPSMARLRLDQQRPGARADDLPRGVREYVPGDPHRDVHWPATARAGRLMVRDKAAATAAEVEVVVDLGPEPSRAGERVASRAMGLGTTLLTRGYRLVLVTRERDVIRADVDDLRMLGRRLAAARPGASVPCDPDAVRVAQDTLP